MEDFWDTTKKEVWDKNWQNLEYETFKFVELRWQDYLKRHLERSDFGFKGYLIGPHVSPRINPCRVRFDIKTWLEVKDKIFQ
jgi:hypothetical protein